MSPPQYNCRKCPGYCCSYPLIPLDKRDVERLARHHHLSFEEAKKAFTKEEHGRKYAMRRKRDDVYGKICRFFDTTKRCCTIYTARPAVCRSFPGGGAAAITTSSPSSAAPRRTTSSSPSPTTTTDRPSRHPANALTSLGRGRDQSMTAGERLAQNAAGLTAPHPAVALAVRRPPRDARVMQRTNSTRGDGGLDVGGIDAAAKAARQLLAVELALPGRHDDRWRRRCR